MGPIANPANFDSAEFLKSLDWYCKENRIDFVETCCDWLDAEALEKQGFRAAPDVTHQIRLTTAEDAWSNLYKTTRNYVRRAEKNGLTVERDSSNGVIKDHFEQLKAVFGKQKIAPPYGLERPLAMRDCLSSGQFMTLKAMHEGRCVATYLLVWDRQTMWGLATASWPDALELRPNELIHWRAIEMACQMGLQRYDLCGGGDYKKKYGAVEVPRVRWMKAYSASAGIGYKAAERGWELMRRLTKFVNSLKPE
jgi:lipid II:glycine glycyltransferase (peptidoglycan interpeptide bridge formation enzyme)